MISQGKRLKNLVFEMHDPVAILKQQYFYAFSDMSEKNKDFKKGCFGTEMKHKCWNRYKSTRYW